MVLPYNYMYLYIYTLYAYSQSYFRIKIAKLSKKKKLIKITRAFNISRETC